MPGPAAARVGPIECECECECDLAQVTDCAAISAIFASAEALERAAKHMHTRAATFKNRVKNPTDEGTRPRGCRTHGCRTHAWLSDPCVAVGPMRGCWTLRALIAHEGTHLG